MTEPNLYDFAPDAEGVNQYTQYLLDTVQATAQFQTQLNDKLTANVPLTETEKHIGEVHRWFHTPVGGTFTLEVEVTDPKLAAMVLQASFAKDPTLPGLSITSIGIDSNGGKRTDLANVFTALAQCMNDPHLGPFLQNVLNGDPKTLGVVSQLIHTQTE